MHSTSRWPSQSKRAPSSRLAWPLSSELRMELQSNMLLLCPCLKNSVKTNVCKSEEGRLGYTIPTSSRRCPRTLSDHPQAAAMVAPPSSIIGTFLGTSGPARQSWVLCRLMACHNTVPCASQHLVLMHCHRSNFYFSSTRASSLVQHALIVVHGCCSIVFSQPTNAKPHVLATPFFGWYSQLPACVPSSVA